MKNKGKEGVEVIVKMKVDSAVAKWLEDQRAYRMKGNVTAKALEFYYDYHYNRKGFFIRLLDIHFEDIKHLLRKVGRFRDGF